MKKIQLTGGVWSATPAPLNAAGRVDTSSVERLIEHHVRMGVTGIMLAGSCRSIGISPGAPLCRSGSTIAARTALI